MELIISFKKNVFWARCGYLNDALSQNSMWYSGADYMKNLQSSSRTTHNPSHF